MFQPLVLLEQLALCVVVVNYFVFVICERWYLTSTFDFVLHVTFCVLHVTSCVLHVTSCVLMLLPVFYTLLPVC